MIIKVKLSRSENINYYHKNLIEVDIEEYLKGVVPSEIGNAPLEAGKAQAVAARTFALNKYKRQGYITDKSNIDQAFRTSRFSVAYNKAHQAVSDTEGQVLFYKNSLITNANYAATNGGRTYSSKEVWGGDRPYLIARDDPWDRAASQGKKNGHGVGMSQAGAKYAASIGKTYIDILNFYYPGTDIRNNYGENTSTIDGGKKTMGLTNIDFVNFLKQMVGQPYWYGTCVYNCTASVLKSKSKQYPSHYASSRMAKYNKAIANKCVCADCVGLGKGFIWTNGGVGVIEAIGTGKKIVSKYGSNGCPDRSANGMFTYAKSKKKNYGPINTIPEIPGLAVRKDGHVGYYIGNGEVVEAYGFAKGIIITKLKDRPWTDWYEFPGVEYVSSSIQKPDTDSEEPLKEYKFGSRTLRKGYSGTDVKELQELLCELDYKAPTDGHYQDETINAVKLFQKDNDLKVDGLAGKKTFAALIAAQGKDKPEETKPAEGKDFTNYPTLKKRMINDYVKELQTILVALGYDVGKTGIDGNFGSKTQQAVRNFQKDKNLKVDGIVGKATWKALGAATV